MKENVLMVIVEMITYNHERYIAQAIESVMMQKASFNYVLLICEDCSTDRTQAVCIEYKRRFPDKIHLNLNEKNLGVHENAIKLHEISFKSKAKYIALCDGDDYWTDPYKLQKQVDFLELNDDFVCHCHNALVNKNEEFIRSYNDLKESKELPRKDLICSLSIPTASVVFRNVLNKNMPDYLAKFNLDIIIYFALSRHGKFFMSNEIMAVYRMHDGGVWTGQNDLTKVNKAIEIQKYILKNLPLTKEEKEAVKQTITGRKVNRLKIFANNFQFGWPYFSDLASVLFAKFTGANVSLKFLVFCMAPNSIINRIQKWRGKI